MIKRKKLEQYISIVPYTTSVLDYYRKARFFVSTSLWEDPGFAIFEAAMSNLTVLSSNCPNEPKEFVENEIRGFEFQNNNLAHLVLKLEKILNLEPNCDEIITKKINAKKYCKKFTIFNHYKKLSKLVS